MTYRFHTSPPHGKSDPRILWEESDAARGRVLHARHFAPVTSRYKQAIVIEIANRDPSPVLSRQPSPRAEHLGH